MKTRSKLYFSTPFKVTQLVSSTFRTSLYNNTALKIKDIRLNEMWKLVFNYYINIYFNMINLYFGWFPYLYLLGLNRTVWVKTFFTEIKKTIFTMVTLSSKKALIWEHRYEIQIINTFKDTSNRQLLKYNQYHLMNGNFLIIKIGRNSPSPTLKRNGSLPFEIRQW